MEYSQVISGLRQLTDRRALTCQSAKTLRHRSQAQTAVRCSDLDSRRLVHCRGRRDGRAGSKESAILFAASDVRTCAHVCWLETTVSATASTYRGATRFASVGGWIAS